MERGVQARMNAVVREIRARGLRMTLGWLVAFTAAPGLQAAERAKSASKGQIAAQITALFQPYQVEQAALSRDGRYLGFLSRRGAALKVTVIEVDNWAAKTELELPDEPGAGAPAFVWADSDLLLVVSSTPVFFVIDAKKRTASRVLDASSFATTSGAGDNIPRRPRFAGLLPDEPGWVLVEGAASVLSLRVPGGEISPTEARLAVFETVKLDLRTGARKSFATATEDLDAVLLHDRQGHPRVMHERAWIPQRFHYRSTAPGGLWSRWEALDRFVGGDAAAFRVTPENFFGQRSFPLCFDRDPNVLYFASNVGRDTHGLFALDLRTKVRTEIAIGRAGHDLVDPGQPFSEAALVFDRATGRRAGVRVETTSSETVWLDAEIAGVQSTLESKFPGRQVRIMQWDDARARFLVNVTTSTDPGRYFVHHRGDGRCVEFRQTAPWLNPDAVHPVVPFAFETPAGVRLAGRLTLPRAPRSLPPPLAVYCHDGPGRRWPLQFDRDAQALAAMGCMVLQVEYRGSSGFGWRHGELPSDAIDRIPIEDTLAAMDWIASRHRFDRRRVAIMGEGLGGYLALRALALHPTAFRCAIGINAPTSLEQLHERPAAATAQELRRFTAETRRFFNEMEAFSRAIEAGSGDLPARMPTLMKAEPAPPVDFRLELNRWVFTRNGVRPASPSVLKHVDKITQPVFLIHDRTHPVIPIEHARELRKALQRRASGVEYLEVSRPFTQGELAARAPVFRQVHEFLNAALYDFDVRIGRPEVVD